MSSTIENIDEELNQVTYEILALTDNLKQKTKESMVVGEKGILKGITIFEEIIKELNPDKINDNVISMIVSYVNITIFRKEEITGHVDTKARYGVNQCYLVIDLYNKSKKRELVRELVS